jgi:NAD(P)-dependent dehydrogenase (short-subunit alcohol dehydrogenase family)
MVKIQRDMLPTQALSAPETVALRKLNKARACYTCKELYTDVHFFYHQLCPKCAEYNYAMRTLRADLNGRVALVTGGRVKIGFQTVLRLLRDGARVILTTRFPYAAAKRLHAEADYANWQDRIQLYGLDLRNIPAVESFAQHLLEVEPSIDIIIHNAAQTIRRPQGFYQDLVNQELNPEATIVSEARQLVVQGAPSTLAISDSAQLLPGVIPALAGIGTAQESSVQIDILPVDRLEDNEERADSRDKNSWQLTLDEVSAPEMLEVQLVNSVAPFLLNSRLKPLLTRSPFARRFIVNVSAMEGQFSRHKTIYHPHTNMAKAALNMMTRTSAEDYKRDGIFMNSVDTGWVTDENPGPKREEIQEEHGFFPPLDIVDGMARIYHPIASGVNDPEEPIYGKFLKDYIPCKW